VLKPAGPVDPQFSILFVQHTDGSPLALLGNFSVHYSGGYQKGLVSADYIGAFCKEIESRLPAKKGFPGMVGIMSNGTSGNTGSFQSTLSKKFAPFEAMEFYGRMLANEAIAATQEITVRRDLELEVKNSTLSLNTRRPDKDRLDWAEQVIAAAEQGEKQSHPWSKVYAQETLHLADYPAEMKIPLQVMRIGDIAIAACPCEVFAETGLMLKESSSLPKTFTMELANGYGGYLPPRKQHRLGGYETWPARSSFLEVNAEEKIRTGLVELLRLVAE
jgi:hypothetical protein